MRRNTLSRAASSRSRLEPDAWEHRCLRFRIIRSHFLNFPPHYSAGENLNESGTRIQRRGKHFPVLSVLARVARFSGASRFSPEFHFREGSTTFLFVACIATSHPAGARFTSRLDDSRCDSVFRKLARRKRTGNGIPMKRRAPISACHCHTSRVDDARIRYATVIASSHCTNATSSTLRARKCLGWARDSVKYTIAVRTISNRELRYSQYLRDIKIARDPLSIKNNVDARAVHALIMPFEST